MTLKIYICDKISKLQTHAAKAVIYKILQLMTKLYILECPVFLELQKYRYQNETKTMRISYYNFKNNIHYESIAPKTTNQSVFQFLMFKAVHPQKISNSLVTRLASNATCSTLICLLEM
jgi:hypothetical protein